MARMRKAESRQASTIRRLLKVFLMLRNHDDHDNHIHKSNNDNHNDNHHNQNWRRQAPSEGWWKCSSCWAIIIIVMIKMMIMKMIMLIMSIEHHYLMMMIIIITIAIRKALQNPSRRILHDIPGARKDKNGQDVSKNAKDTDRDEENTFYCKYRWSIHNSTRL